MTRRGKFHSPTLVIPITEEGRQTAIKSSSGGCLISDSIPKLGPYTNPVSDMATIRFTDREAGLRYTYLTPPTAQHCLLAFDQGWPNPVTEIVLKRAVKITPITRARTGRASVAAIAESRAERITFLEAKAETEPLSKGEKIALTRMKNASPAPERPTSTGPIDVQVNSGGTYYGTAVVHGGQPLIQGAPHPNLLRGRNRHFGAKLADPGLAFREAVEAAVAERLAGEQTPATETQ